MIDRQRQVAHWPNGDRIYTIVADHYRALLNRPDAQNGRLGLIDNWRGEQAAADAVVSDREGAALSLIRLEPARSRARGEIIDCARQAQYVFLVGIAHNRHD